MNAESLPFISLAAAGCSYGARWFVNKMPDMQLYKKWITDQPDHKAAAIEESFKIHQKFVSDLSTVSISVFTIGVANKLVGLDLPFKANIEACFYIVVVLALLAVVSVGPNFRDTVFK